jgi:YD repeat-containing protein
VVRPDGSSVAFAKGANGWATVETDMDGRLTTDGATVWTFTGADDSVDTFDFTSGRLLTTRARAISRRSLTIPPAAEQTTVAYDLMATAFINKLWGTFTVTDALGKQTIYTDGWVGSVGKAVWLDEQASPNSPATRISFSFDANGNIASRTDKNGNVTTFANNAHGQVLTREQKHVQRATVIVAIGAGLLLSSCEFWSVPDITDLRLESVGKFDHGTAELEKLDHMEKMVRVELSTTRDLAADVAEHAVHVYYLASFCPLTKGAGLSSWSVVYEDISGSVVDIDAVADQYRRSPSPQAITPTSDRHHYRVYFFAKSQADAAPGQAYDLYSTAHDVCLAVRGGAELGDYFESNTVVIPRAEIERALR